MFASEATADGGTTTAAPLHLLAMMRWLALLPLIAVSSSCNQRQRPPYAEQGRTNAPVAKPEAGTTFVELPNDTDNPCETVVELPIVKPNFYFVIDASGSMKERMPGTRSSRYRAAIAAISDMLEDVQTRVNFGATVFPNTFSGASCQAGNEVFALEDGSKSVNGVSTLEALNIKLHGYLPEGGSPISPTLEVLYPTLSAFEGETYVFLFSDGAPNCNLARPCEASECILNLEGASFYGATCDESLNCCGPDWFPHLCLDRDPTLDELTRLADIDIATYIIGMPGGVAYSSLLNEMAIAGGTARSSRQPPNTMGGERPDAAPKAEDARDAHASSPDAQSFADVELDAPIDDGLLYYQISDAPSLALALATLSREILVDCTLKLDFAPTKPEFLRVMVGDEALPSDQWSLTTNTEVELLGRACEEWRAGKLPQVRVQQTCRSPAR